MALSDLFGITRYNGQIVHQRYLCKPLFNSLLTRWVHILEKVLHKPSASL